MAKKKEAKTVGRTAAMNTADFQEAMSQAAAIGSAMAEAAKRFAGPEAALTREAMAFMALTASRSHLLKLLELVDSIKGGASVSNDELEMIEKARAFAGYLPR